MLAEARCSEDLRIALAQRLGNRLSTAAAVRAQHGRDESYHPAQAPEASAAQAFIALGTRYRVSKKRGGGRLREATTLGAWSR